MFKLSLQRHARFGAVACRQLAALPSRTSSLQFSKLQTRFASPVATHAGVIRQLAPRLYSSASSAAVEDVVDESPESGLVTKFADMRKLGVDEGLVRAITQGMGYESMTEVQSRTINPALNGVDLVAQAKTGTGKTLAFLVPVLQRILRVDPSLATARNNSRFNSSASDIRAIILSPTRELAEQIGVEARKVTRNTGIVVQTAVGGTQKREALSRMQREGCHVLVATPGRLLDILSDPRSHVAAPRLAALVLDEADRMLDVGFSDTIREILDNLPSVREVDRQTLLYSATIPMEVVHLAKDLVKVDNFEFVQTISPDDVDTHEKVPQHVVSTRGYEQWLPSIYEIISKGIQTSKNDPEAMPFKGMLFFSNTATVELAYQVLRQTSLGRQLPIFQIHSKLTQAQRTRSADNFRRVGSGLLISSDVTARGMDFPNVSDVIQVGLPPDRDQYIHRVGRTGRAGKSGQGWLVIAEPEINEARERLTNLPIKPYNKIESANHTVGETAVSEDVQTYFDEVSQAYQRTPEDLFETVYSAILGQKLGRKIRVDDVVQLLNGWALQGFGLDEPPALSQRTVANRGLSRVPGIRVQGFRQPRRDSSGFGDSDGGFGGRSSFNQSRERDSFASRFSGRDDGFGQRGSGFGGRDRGSGGRGQGFGGRDQGFGGRGQGFGGRNQNSGRFSRSEASF